MSLVLAELAAFRRDWWGGYSFEELYDAWDYKPVSSNDACKRREVRQIRFRKDFRVLLTLAEGGESVWLLEAYRKTSEHGQDAAIERACNRARAIWED